MKHNYIFDTDRILAIPISEVVAEFDSLHRRGSHQVALCPWHDDHDPSLVLYEGTDQNHCVCHVCRHGGDVIRYARYRLGNAGSPRGFNETCLWLSSRFSIPLLDGGQASSNITPRKSERTTAEKASLPLAYVPNEYMQKSVSVKNSLSKCIGILFGQEAALRVTQDYCLGLHRNWYHQDGTIFWSIDEQGLVHNGKVQCYCTDPRSADFSKSYKTVPAYWLTEEFKRKGFVPEGHCLDIGGLFGAHLIALRPVEDEIVIVESPKNAIFGAAAFPEYLWLAAGNKSALNSRVLKCVDGRVGMIYPDRDAIDEWKRYQRKLPELRNFKVKDFCETNAPVNASSKYDIADYIMDAVSLTKQTDCNV